jgi:predicted GIY-YIG superfamily endonuclease
MNTFFVYILKCCDGSYYVGHTDNIEKRMFEHKTGTFGGYTARKSPVKLVFAQSFNLREQAFISERKIKGWTRAKKEALIKENWNEISNLAKKKF